MAAIDEDRHVEEMLEQLFDSAAAKSLAVINQDDAEPEMARFLHEVKNHPDQRPFVVRLFTDSFSDRFHMKWAPWQFLQFCMHALRWSELRDFIFALQTDDVRKRGAASSGIWNDILATFEDNWDGAENFQEFKTEVANV